MKIRHIISFMLVATTMIATGCVRPKSATVAQNETVKEQSKITIATKPIETKVEVTKPIEAIKPTETKSNEVKKVETKKVETKAVPKKIVSTKSVPSKKVSTPTAPKNSYMKPRDAFEYLCNYYGVSASDKEKWAYIIKRESDWDPYATNSKSGAYGLGQAYPASDTASAGADWKTNPLTQLKWMYSYMMQRYGSINKAYQFWINHKWY